MKLLIANRGEIAVRIARTCATLGVPTVAVYSDADAHALHVDACDEGVRIGGARAADSYLRAEALLAAAARSGATAVHPGYGFLSERAAFARAVRDAGLVWVGPDPEVIAAMGDKLAAKRVMAAAGVPVLPGVEVASGAEADAAAAELGYPLLVKAVAGGGGRGMRTVDRPGDLAAAVASAQREAEAAFGDGRVFLERLVPRPHHVEVQILGDRHGGLVHLFERECSVQRRHQKVIEESPSPRLPEPLRGELYAAALAAGRALGYTNAGTVEFVAEERGGALTGFSFLEVNTRLQVEHPVTEQVVRVAGPGGPVALDLVALQLAVAEGAALPFTQDQLSTVGHAIEARLYAEDPDDGYRPSPGRVRGFAVPPAPAGPAPPAAPVVRWDLGVGAGREVPLHYDPLLAKATAHAPTRAAAARTLARALERTLVAGVATNRDQLVAVLRDEVFLDGAATTAFLAEREDVLREARLPERGLVEAAAVAATLAGLGDAPGVPGLAAVPPAFTNGPLAWPPVRFHSLLGELTTTYRTRRDGSFDLTVDGAALHAVVLAAVTGPPRDVGADARRGSLVVELEGHRWTADWLRWDDRWAVLLPGGQVDLAQVPRFPEAARREETGACLAPMPGQVVRVAVAGGDPVARGAVVVVLEAMKMEHLVRAPADGTVTAVHVAPAEQVTAGQLLVQVEPSAP